MNEVTNCALASVFGSRVQSRGDGCSPQRVPRDGGEAWSNGAG